MAESTGLLNLHTGNRITSSNLVLSAENALQNTLQGVFSKKYPQKYPKNAEWPNKKLLAGQHLSVKDEKNALH